MVPVSLVCLSILFCCTILCAGNEANETLIKYVNDEPHGIDGISRKIELEVDDSLSNQTLHELFEDGVQAYLEEDWSRCIENFNRVTHGYKMYKRMITNCRQLCRTKAAGEAPIFAEDIEDLHFFEKKVVETLCLLTCNQEYREIAGAKALKTLPRETEFKLIERRVYEYLHICYFKKDRYQDAANAAFTFLVVHPDHRIALKSMKYYMSLAGVETENVINLEASPYVSIYFDAVSAYEEERYADAARLFEASLQSYFDSEKECRFYCEGPFDQGWHPEFTSSLANHFTYCLKCKRSCSQWLNNVNGDYRGDMLKTHYNYLQFSYYKLGKLKAACKAVETYLLFDPVDSAMLKNKQFYSTQPTVKPEYFQPTQEGLMYIKRQEYELSLLRYISKEFSTINKRLEKSFSPAKSDDKNSTDRSKSTSHHHHHTGKVKNEDDSKS